jgi:hypothetical protein
MNFFMTCYNWIGGAYRGNAIHYFFTFANRPNKPMKVTLQGKLAHFNKWRGG